VSIHKVAVGQIRVVDAGTMEAGRCLVPSTPCSGVAAVPTSTPGRANPRRGSGRTSGVLPIWSRRLPGFARLNGGTKGVRGRRMLNGPGKEAQPRRDAFERSSGVHLHFRW